MQSMKKCPKNPVYSSGGLISVFILSYFIISYEHKNARQPVLFAELAFIFFSIVPNDFLFMCLLARLFAKMRHLLRLRNCPDKKERAKRNGHVGMQKGAILTISCTALLIGLNIKFYEIFGKQHVYNSLVF